MSLFTVRPKQDEGGGRSHLVVCMSFLVTDSLVLGELSVGTVRPEHNSYFYRQAGLGWAGMLRLRPTIVLESQAGRGKVGRREGQTAVSFSPPTSYTTPHHTTQ